MKLREFKIKLDQLKEEYLDLEVHILTEMEGFQHEQMLGDIAIPTSYVYPDPVGVPNRIVLLPVEF